jgi:hypothetical protein
LKHERLLSAAAVRLLRAAAACVVLAAASVHAGAQTQPTQPAPSAGAKADEEFELNIDRRRISEKEFHAETAVETDGARGLQLGVGVALRASDIEALLLGVRGHVRFRGSLAPVLRLLEARRGTPTQTPPP